MILRRPVSQPRISPPETAAPTPPPQIKALAEPAATEDPATVLADLGIGVAAADPAELVAQIATALEAGDLTKVGRLIGKSAFDPETLARLKALSSTPLKVRQPNGIREVGELELNAHSRWARVEVGHEEANTHGGLLSHGCPAGTPLFESRDGATLALGSALP